jgi:hypothetical protein
MVICLHTIRSLKLTLDSYRQGDLADMESRSKNSAKQNWTAFVLALGLTLTFSMSFAAETPPKRTLKSNNMEVYNQLPENAATFPDIFTKGMFYGRLRTHYFYYENHDGSLHDPTGFGLGGSVIYKTAPFYGFSGTAGLYTSQNLGLLNQDDALFGRTGKDTFSRYDRIQEGDWGMTVLAQAYGQYHFFKSDIKYGRQIYESFLTASNDSKMIPLTFEGVTLASADIPATTVSLAYLTAVKNRDHTTFHDVITYSDGKNRTVTVDGTTYNVSNWNNQDDSVAHKGLSYANLKAAGKDVDNELVVAGLTNQSIKNLKMDLGYGGVPDLFYTWMAEANYAITLPGSWILTPGLRYMQQCDDDAGEVGGAALSGRATALNNRDYDDWDSVDAALYAARIVLEKGPGKYMVGYSRISDDADFIAPWRGFPTGGYTRTMGEYNWYAHSESWMIQGTYDLGKAGLIKGFTVITDYVYTGEDDQKEALGGTTVTDRSIYHMDLIYKLPFMPDVETKLRLKWADAEDSTAGADLTYNEIRFEVNYLF